MAVSDVRRGVAEANGIRIAYEDIGDINDPAVLLIMGFSAQLTFWRDSFCDRIVESGYRVIRFDNRDVGLSTKLDDERIRGSVWWRLVRYELGLPSPVPYTLFDMAGDTIGLLDYLGIDAVHVVGGSMGGMIAQIVAAEHPERTRSLGVLFSSTNQALLPLPHPRALLALLKRPTDTSRAAVIANSVRARQILAGSGFPEPRELTEAAVTRDYERDFTPAGVIRQFGAVTGTGSLTAYTKRIQAPTVVIHGAADPLIRPAGGRAVAAAVPGARLHIVARMGHNLPVELDDQITSVLAENFARAGSGRVT